MQSSILDELERDLGLAARLLVMANAGGQRRYVPLPNAVEGSVLAAEFGQEVCCWFAGRFGGEYVKFPSRRGSEQDERASLLRAAILDAGLTDPKRSANDIATEFGVTERRVYQIRTELRKEEPVADLPLFSLR